MNREIDLSFLRDWQKNMIKELQKSKYGVLIVHRRAWKTIVILAYLLYKALSNPKSDFWYIAPYLNQAKTIAWEALIQLSKNIPWIEINISELTIRFPNWSRIRLFWADNPHAMRWLNLKWAVMDEYSQIPKNLFWEIIFPMINAFGKEWFAIFIWTPNWYDHFYDLYKKAKKNDKWYTLLLPVTESGVLPDIDIEEDKQMTEPDQFAQEYMCDFGVAVKWSYYWKYISDLKNEWRLVKSLYDPVLPVHTYWDLWMDDSTAILFVQFWWKEVRLIDYYEDRGRGLEHYVEVLNMKDYSYDTHHLPHDAQVKELWTWATRKETLEKLLWFNVNIEVIKRQLIEDWINAVRSMFNYVYVDSWLENMLSQLSLYEATYNEKTGLFWKPKHDENSHLADTWRYLAMTYEGQTENINDYIESFTPDYSNII